MSGLYGGSLSNVVLTKEEPLMLAEYNFHTMLWFCSWEARFHVFALSKICKNRLLFEKGRKYLSSVVWKSVELLGSCMCLE